MEQPINWQLSHELSRFHAEEYRRTLQEIVSAIHFREGMADGDLLLLVFRKALGALSNGVPAGETESQCNHSFDDLIQTPFDQPWEGTCRACCQKVKLMAVDNG